MKRLNYIVIALILATLSSKSAFALNCVSTAYGNLCSGAPLDYDVRKTVSKTAGSEGTDRITGISQGDTFTFYFRVSNNTLNEVTLTLEDNLPSNLERVGGIGYTEKVTLYPKSRKTLEMVVKVKDSEFQNKNFFQKCVVNKANLYKDKDLKDSATATVCYGKGFGSKLSGIVSNDVLGADTPGVVRPVDEDNTYIFGQNTTINNYFNNFYNFSFGLLNFNFNIGEYLNGCYKALNDQFSSFFIKQWLLFTFWILRGF